MRAVQRWRQSGTAPPAGHSCGIFCRPELQPLFPPWSPCSAVAPCDPTLLGREVAVTDRFQGERFLQVLGHELQVVPGQEPTDRRRQQ